MPPRPAGAVNRGPFDRHLRYERAQRGTGCGVDARWDDKHEKLRGQPAQSRCQIAAQAALDGFQRGAAEDGADHDAVALPDPVGGGLISAGWTGADAAHQVRCPVGRRERREDRAKHRRVDTMARALELNALQPARPFIHLEIGDERHTAERHIAQHEIRIAVAKVQGPRQNRRASAEMGEKRTARLTPLRSIPNVYESFRLCCGHRQKQTRYNNNEAALCKPNRPSRKSPLGAATGSRGTRAQAIYNAERYVSDLMERFAIRA